MGSTKDICKHRVVILSSILAVLAVASCVKLPSDNNKTPEAPSIELPAGACSFIAPCSLFVTGVDRDGDELAYQFEITDSTKTTVLSDWTSLFDSGETWVLTMTGERGHYSLRARSRDLMNSISDFSDSIVIDFMDLAPMSPSAPAGDSVLYPGRVATFRTHADDPENEYLRLRYDLGDGQTISDWSVLQLSHYDYSFTCTYDNSGSFGLRVQAMDSAGNISPWSEATTVRVVPKLQRVGGCEIPGQAGRVVVQENVAWVTTASQGIKILDVESGSNPSIVGSSSDFNARAVSVRDTLGFVLVDDGFSGNVLAFSLGQSLQPSLTGQLADARPLYSASSIDVQGNYALIGTDWAGHGVVLADIADPTNMGLVSDFQRTSITTTTDVCLRYPFGYFAIDGGYLLPTAVYVSDLTNLGVPEILDSLRVSKAGQLVLAGQYLYLANDSITVLDVQNPALLHSIASTKIGLATVDAHGAGSHLAAACGIDGVVLLDISRPGAPAIIGYYNDSSTCTGVFCGQDFLFVASQEMGFEVLSYSNPPTNFAPLGNRSRGVEGRFSRGRLNLVSH